jgi:excisionase family DNA binding protein
MMVAGMNSRSRFSSDRNVEATTSGHVDGRRQRSDQINFFTIAEVAERLDVSIRTVSRWIKSGDLVAHRFGNAVRIADSDLRDFLTRHRGD